MTGSAAALPRVALLSLGGTIAMTHAGTSSGVVPSLDGQTLAAAVPQLAAVAEVAASSLTARPSASLSFSDVLAAARTAREQVDAGAAGVVITQGTDTLEETAFLLDLLWDREQPLVLTGAMRNPTQPSADGPANLLTAVTVAAALECSGLGTLVVMNDEIHAARFVMKRRSTSLSAFESPDSGPIGHVTEGVVRLLSLPSPLRHPVLTTPLNVAGIRVALIPATFDDDGDLIQICAHQGYDGIVVAAFGAGHLSEAAAARAIAAAADTPVVLSTRTGAGGVLSATYGFNGSETHLLRGGLISAGMLHPLKARVLLHLLLAAKADRATIKAAFQAYRSQDETLRGAFMNHRSRTDEHGNLRQHGPQRPAGEESV